MKPCCSLCGADGDRVLLVEENGQWVCCVQRHCYSRRQGSPGKFTAKHHLQFIRAMKRKGLEVIAYSGRGMYGDECPAVVVPRYQEKEVRRATRVPLAIDSMGMDIVLYTR